MQIHELTLTPRQKTKRIGRGGKRGTTSGKGTKGQGAHGKKKDPLFEGGRTSLIDRMKKTRGFKSPHAKKVTIALGKIEEKYVDGETVTLETLFAKGIITQRGMKVGVKIVSSGTLSKKLSLGEGIRISETAKAYFK